MCFFAKSSESYLKSNFWEKEQFWWTLWTFMLMWTSAKKSLQLISSLIDGTYDSNEYSREVVIVVQLVTSHASRSHWKYVPDFLFEVPDKLVPLIHSKNQETPIMFYNFLKIYMTNWSRNLLNHFLHLGIWFFYDRVL